jgi:siroheme synthase
MGREGSLKPNYEILSYVTTSKDRVLSGKALALWAKDEKDAKEISTDIAKAMKADVVQMKNGDFLIIKV